MSEAYEMMYILRPNLLEEEIRENVSKYRNLLAENGATDIQIKLWGKRRLAYPINKYQEGTYILVNYQGDGKQIAVVERAMRLSEEVIRYLTMKLKEIPTISEDSFKDFDKLTEATPKEEQPSQPAPEATEATEAEAEEQPSQPAPEATEATEATEAEEQPSQPSPEATEAEASQSSPEEIEA